MKTKIKRPTRTQIRSQALIYNLPTRWLAALARNYWCNDHNTFSIPKMMDDIFHGGKFLRRGLTNRAREAVAIALLPRHMERLRNALKDEWNLIREHQDKIRAIEYELIDLSENKKPENNNLASLLR